MNTLAAAHEINAAWIRCLEKSGTPITDCPTDEDVQEIIEKHLNPQP